MSRDAGQLVEEYLELCQARDLTSASRLLADDNVIVFPGGVRYRGLADMAADAAHRYRSVRKRREAPIVADLAEGTTLVLSRGSLEGEALDGTPFSGVRYLDLFLVAGGLIREQHVFNDLAEVGVVHPGGQACHP